MVRDDVSVLLEQVLDNCSVLFSDCCIFSDSSKLRKMKKEIAYPIVVPTITGIVIPINSDFVMQKMLIFICLKIGFSPKLI